MVGIYVAPNSTRVYDLQQLKKGYRLREISIQLLYDTSNFKIDQRTVLKNLFLTCLAHDPAERVLSAGQIAESLRQAIGANPKIVSTEVDSTHVPLAIGDDVMLKKEGFEV